ncbi:MAG TPA: hypothetical protein ENK28_07325 [Aliiroseovarius sp.]|nr:hypothetical protein [Aliiroseovarius sp.]
MAPRATGPDLRPVALLFSDDSTLFFCLRMRESLRKSRLSPPVQMVWYAGENALSYRQMSQLLPEGPDRAVDKAQLAQMAISPHIQAIVTSRVYRPLGDVMKKQPWRVRADRPCVISFLGGLDFSPEKGFQNRRNSDVVYLFPKPATAAFRQSVHWRDEGWQDVGFGHPHFLTPRAAPADLDQRRDIFFYPQALSPSTRRGRLHVLKALIAMARHHSDRTIWIKLRHLPSENRAHLHREKYAYPDLVKTLPDVPKNLKFTACSMDRSLQKAALGITCTSTAAIDLVRAGIPCIVHLDYVDNYRDPLVGPMRKLFAGSALITSLEDMLNLRATPPDQTWVDQMFCPRDLGDDVIAKIAEFRARPFQVRDAGP